MARTIVVGDVHGCRAELEQLLSKVGLCGDDTLVFVGDLVVRGPDSPGVVRLVQRLGATVVRGNHEEKLLRIHDADRTGLGPEMASTMHRRLASSLDEAAWALLSSSVLVADLPTHGARVVHAGLVPGVRMEHQARKTLMTIRTLGPMGEPSDRSNGVAWGTRYHGPLHVVFGHHAQPEPQIHPYATGIDTGCVYGGTLTAMVLRENERPPRSKDRRDALVMVRARRSWFAGRGRR